MPVVPVQRLASPRQRAAPLRLPQRPRLVRNTPRASGLRPHASRLTPHAPGCSPSGSPLRSSRPRVSPIAHDPSSRRNHGPSMWSDAVKRISNGEAAACPPHPSARPARLPQASQLRSSWAALVAAASARPPYRSEPTPRRSRRSATAALDLLEVSSRQASGISVAAPWVPPPPSSSKAPAHFGSRGGHPAAARHAGYQAVIAREQASRSLTITSMAERAAITSAGPGPGAGCTSS